MDTTWDLANREALAHVSLFVRFLDVTKLTPKQSISNFFVNPLEG